MVAKKWIYTLCAGLVAATAAYGQSDDAVNDKYRTDISEVTVSTDGDSVRVSFEAYFGKAVTRGGRSLIYSPVISDGDYHVSLPALVVQNKRAAAASKRNRWAAKGSPAAPRALYAKRGRTVEYRATAGFQQWMEGADIVIEKVDAGCCSVKEESITIAENILFVPKTDTIAPMIAEEPEHAAPVTIADSVAEIFPFVQPASNYDPDISPKDYLANRENSIILYFRINSYMIEGDFSDNRQTLKNLIAAIDVICASGDGHVEYVVVAGFSSPDGILSRNDRLAWERAVSIKEYIIGNTELPDKSVVLYNGSEDWQGLRELVEKSPIPDKEEVLHIIDNTPVWDSDGGKNRLRELKELNDGEAYRYMVDNLFPQLRSGAFIRVFYENNEVKSLINTRFNN